MFHLGWFVGNGYSVQSWNRDWAGTDNEDWYSPALYSDAARALERAAFDFMVFQDGLMVPDIFGGSMEADLKFAQEIPRSDPTAMVAILSQVTKDLGYIPTISTSFYPPFMAARMLTTLDQLSGGHAGGNLVTSASDRAAQNFGFDNHHAHDLRYEMAEEWADLVTQLWDSWEPGSVIMDTEKHVFADYTKVHPIEFEGRFYSSRGPLNTPPGPQGRPVISQAGGSPAGREFGARFADVIFCVPNGLDSMRAYREDIHRRMEKYGREPGECKILFMVDPVIGETDQVARDIAAARADAKRSDAYVEEHLSVMSYFSGIDFAAFDLDQPMPDLDGKVNAQQSTMARYQKDAAGKTLRELVIEHNMVATIDLVGSPATVAAKMGEVMEEVGGDGFLLSGPLNRKNLAEITDGLVPELKRLGLTRPRYTKQTLRENLREF
ncbi:NtaA/DmoA family FMN-dependent monooxygenase [Herbiconiux sp.]|uniref:NtaA/DmoA family FMN-dependent monooxygenase n=1 Tax=Herbiconiux sp. TaxID=1871186 RepID=UPI0025C2A385|nr:NtaA/DmoA family FMN-dependent monooxygenase [Herbiconiux sp.]